VCVYLCLPSFSLFLSCSLFPALSHFFSLSFPFSSLSLSFSFSLCSFLSSFLSLLFCTLERIWCSPSGVARIFQSFLLLTVISDSIDLVQKQTICFWGKAVAVHFLVGLFRAERVNAREESAYLH
jgi:hypothetical protein